MGVDSAEIRTIVLNVEPCRYDGEWEVRRVVKDVLYRKGVNDGILGLKDKRANLAFGLVALRGVVAGEIRR